MDQYKSVLNSKISNQRIENTFTKEWVKKLYVGYYEFLIDSKYSTETIYRHLSKFEKIMLNADKTIYKPTDINYEWLVKELEKIEKLRGSKDSILLFFEKEKLVILPKLDQKEIDEITNIIGKIPDNFKRLIDLYFNERLNFRNKQIANNASRPLGISSINNEINTYVRFINWIVNQGHEKLHWDMITEELINNFLVGLPIRNREIVRTKLYSLFKFAKTKRFIINIPMYHIKSREYESNVEYIEFDVQKTISRNILFSEDDRSDGCLISSLCFYHALTSKEISNIKLEDIDADGMKINIKNRPPVFLGSEDLLILQKYLLKRNEIENIRHKKYLFVSNCRSTKIKDSPVSKKFILDKAKEVTGYNPKILRITCLRNFSQMYGPQFLIDAFGISMTQASRYGRFEEYLVEEEISSQKKEFSELIKDIKC